MSDFVTSNPWGASAAANGLSPSVTLTRAPVMSQADPAVAPSPSQEDQLMAETEAAEALEAAGTASPAASPAAAPSPDTAPPAWEGELRQAWGDKYEANCNTVGTWLNTLPEGMRKALETSPRGADPGFVVEVLHFARQPQPSAWTRDGIEKFIRTNPQVYRKSEAIQFAYRAMIEADLKKGK